MSNPLSPSRRRFAILGGGSLLALSGCGGGGDEPPPPPAPPPGEPPPPTPAPTPPPPGQPADTLPVIAVQPQSMALPASPTVTLRVDATGPNLAYQWKHNGNPIAGATQATVEVPNPAGTIARYSVTVRNGAGSVESDEAVVAATVALEQLSLLAGGLGGTGMLEGRGSLSRLFQTNHVAVAPSGDVYFNIQARDGNFLAKASPQRDVRIIGATESLSGLAVGDEGTIYVFGGHVIYKLLDGPYPNFSLIAGKVGTPYRLGGFEDGRGDAAFLKQPRWPVAGSNGQVYFLEPENRAVRRVSPDGTVVTLAGAPGNTAMVDGQGPAAGFSSLKGLARMPDGHLLILDGNRWRRMTPDGTVTTLPDPVAADIGGVMVAADASSVISTVLTSVVRVGLDGSETTLAGSRLEAGYVEGPGAQARFRFFLTTGERPVPARLPTGELLLPDGWNGVIRKVDAATGQTSAWLGAAEQAAVVDGTGADARFVAPFGGAVDPAGNLHVLSRRGPGTTYDFLNVRKITPAGVVTTVLPETSLNGGPAIDAVGNYYGTRLNAIVKVTPDGRESIYAGRVGALGFADGPAADARFSWPTSPVFDSHGNLYVVDLPERLVFEGQGTIKYGNTIRKITPDGQVSTVAGVPGVAYTLPGTPPAHPDAISPSQLAIDAADNLYVLEGLSRSIRRRSSRGGPWVEVMNLGSPFAQHMAVTPAGTVYYARGTLGRGFAVWRVEPHAPPVLVAGAEDPTSAGVRTGPLPGTLNQITGLIAAADGSLFVMSENSILKIGPK